jgi:acetamidase/formamidase
MTAPGTFGSTIHLGPEPTYVGHSKDLPPVAHIASGDSISLELPNACHGQLTQQSTAKDVIGLQISRANPSIGPIHVEGAKAGDVLQVDVLTVEPGTWAFTVQKPGMGLLADLFPDPWIKIWSYKNGRGLLTDGVSIPLEPFPGVMCTAQAVDGEHFAIHVPQRVGGNMDLKQARAGSSLYFPVEVDGGLLSIGDPHCAQGDGEVCGSAIEGSIELTVRVSVRRDMDVDGPELDVTRPLERRSAAERGYHVTTGTAPDLRKAAHDSIERMVVYLGRTYGLDPQHAYCLCSVAVDLKISEIVDAPNWVVSAFLPKDVFDRTW